MHKCQTLVHQHTQRQHRGVHFALLSIFGIRRVLGHITHKSLTTVSIAPMSHKSERPGPKSRAIQRSSSKGPCSFITKPRLFLCLLTICDSCTSLWQIMSTTACVPHRGEKGVVRCAQGAVYAPEHAHTHIASCTTHVRMLLGTTLHAVCWHTSYVAHVCMHALLVYK